MSGYDSKYYFVLLSLATGYNINFSIRKLSQTILFV